MSNQAKVFEMSWTEPEPLNRRVYAAAKAPFHYLWVFLSAVGLPFIQVLPFAFVTSAVLDALTKNGSWLATWRQDVPDIVRVGLVLTLLFGVVFGIGKLIRWLKRN